MEIRKLNKKDSEPREPKPVKPIPVYDRVKPTKLPKPKFDIGTFESINWKIIPKALLNGVFRYFTKFNLFLVAHRPSWIDKIIELLRTLINKLTKKGK